MLEVKYRVLSEPAEVWWAGFRSDTYRLQQQGWQIAAEEDVMRDSIRLLLKHRDMKLYALTDASTFRYRQQEMHRQPLAFHVVLAAPHFQVQQCNVDFAAFREIDAKPQVLHAPTIKSIEDFRIFATPLVRTEEIIVEPQTVSAMLEQIRKMQAPEQARIRAQQRLAEGRPVGEEVGAGPQQRFHAQIISIADRRAA